jgi:D-alanyl-D-alanine carboxypeptidase
MKKLSIALRIILVWALPFVLFGQDFPRTLTYEKVLDSLQKINIAPGGVLGVYEDEKIWIGSYGYQDVKNKVLFENTTQYRCGSISKVFVAVIALQLIDEGKLCLTTPITNYIPTLSHQIPDANQITIQYLLEHSSGLGHPTEDLFSYKLKLALFPKSIGKLDYQQRLEQYAYHRKLKNEPGKDIYYSNAGYWLLGLILENTTQESIEKLIQNRICKPLELSSTYLTRSNDQAVAKGYNYLFNNKLRLVSKWDRADNDGDPAAGLISNTPDLLHFLQALFEGKLLSETSLALMLTVNQFPACEPDCAYGLGIESWNSTLFKGFGKNGSSIGVDANVIYFPDQKISMVLFFNYGGGNHKYLIDYILQKYKR